MTEVKNILPVDRVATGGEVGLTRDNEGLMSDHFYYSRKTTEGQSVGECNYMINNNLERIVGGFYADGVTNSRKRCFVREAHREACEASDAVTRKTDYYLSMFEFPEAFLQEVAVTGKTAGYNGVCGGQFLWFDIDREGDLESAVKDTMKLIEHIVATFGLTPENMQVFFSGAKGFHVGISTQVFGEAAMPSEGFNSLCKAVAERIGKEAGVTSTRASTTA